MTGLLSTARCHWGLLRRVQHLLSPDNDEAGKILALTDPGWVASTILSRRAKGASRLAAATAPTAPFALP